MKLRRQIEELLQANDTAGNFLVTPADRDGEGRTALAEAPGDRIGRYQLLEKIGEGGCGTVYLAEQLEPVRRQVGTSVSSVRLSGDGRALLAKTSENTLQVYDAETGRELTPPLVHPKRLVGYALNGDATRAVTITRRQVHGWHTATGQPAWEPIELKTDIINMDLSSDGEFTVVAGWDGSVRVYETRTGRAAGDTMRHRGGVAAGHFSFDGRQLATAGWDGTARVWEAASGAPASPSLRHAGFVVRHPVQPGPLATAHFWA